MAASLPTSPIGHVEFRLSFPCTRLYGPDNVDTILRRACDVLPLSKLEYLSIFSSERAHSKLVNWSEVFRHFTEVTTVQVSGRGSVILLQALTLPRRSRGKGHKTRRIDNGRGAGVQVPIFPKLTSLLLARLNFSDVVPGLGVLHDLVLTATLWRKAKKSSPTARSAQRRSLCSRGSSLTSSGTMTSATARMKTMISTMIATTNSDVSDPGVG